MEEEQLTPEAQQARDEILDHLLQGHYVQAIRRYQEASGKHLSEAKTVIDRLRQVLDKPGLDAAEKSFLAGFRASLNNPERPPLEQPTLTMPEGASSKVSRSASRRPRPFPHVPLKRRKQTAETSDRYAADGTPTGPPGVAPVLLHVLLAQLTLSAAFVLFSAVFGALGYVLNIWIVMVPGLVVGVAAFMLFPALLDPLFQRLGVRRWTRTPALLFDFGLGIVLLMTGLWGSYTMERWLWYRGAETIPLTHVEQLADKKARAGEEIYHLDSLRVLPSPAATYSDHTIRSADRGGSYTDHWHVALIDTESASEKPCLWYGWRSYTGRSGFDDPLPPTQSGNHYVIADYDRHYRRAVQYALNRSDAPECTTIVNRIPPPAEETTRMAQRLLTILALTAGLPWLFLLLIASYQLYRRLRPAKPESR